MPVPILRGAGYGDTVLDILHSQAYREWLVDLPQADIALNIQQLAKTPVIMDCLVPREGNSFIALDFASLEPHVAAELSGDPTYTEIYASGKPHDVYLYVAIKLLEEWGPKINAVYNIDNPTKESVAAAKKEFKPQRTMVKPIHLGAGYGAGAAKIRRQLMLSGIFITLEEAQALMKAYWGPKLFGRIKDWEQELLAEREDRGGYILNGLNRPIIVSDKKEKDIVNTVCQSTGHDLLEIWSVLTWNQFRKEKISKQILIPIDDMHDEMILESPDTITKEVAEIMEKAVGLLNQMVKPRIPLKGEADIGKNLTAVKQPDPCHWYDKAKARWKVS